MHSLAHQKMPPLNAYCPPARLEDTFNHLFGKIQYIASELFYERVDRREQLNIYHFVGEIPDGSLPLRSLKLLHHRHHEVMGLLFGEDSLCGASW